MKTSERSPAQRAKKKPKASAPAVGQQSKTSLVTGTQLMGRSRVSNAAARGSIIWLDNVDKRGPIPRRFKDLVALVTSDLASDPSQLSEAQRQLIRRIASLSVWCESQEAKMADGDEINIGEFQRTANSLRRLCEALGIERRQKDVTPDPLEYARNYDRRHAEDAEEVSA